MNPYLWFPIWYVFAFNFISGWNISS